MRPARMVSENHSAARSISGFWASIFSTNSLHRARYSLAGLINGASKPGTESADKRGFSSEAACKRAEKLSFKNRHERLFERDTHLYGGAGGRYLRRVQNPQFIVFPVAARIVYQGGRVGD